MRSRLRALLAAGVSLAMMGGLATFASANTELVPGSRLVAPYYANDAGRTTFLFFTNASVPPINFNVGLHLEFYDKDCNRQDTQDVLSVGDIDQMNVSNIVPAGFTRGWIDVDVRAAIIAAIPAGFPVATSYQWNSVMGTVLVSDVPGDFAFAYPMASAQGRSTTGGAGLPIVTHAGNGTALVWTGSYEPFPWNVYVPMFLAEGGANGNAAWLALAGPADGNWDLSNNGEAPGQEIGKGLAGDLLSLSANIFDGCEQIRSRNFEGHYIFTKFNDPTTLNIPLNNFPNPPGPWNAIPIPGLGGLCGSWPSVDEASNQAIGWVDIVNSAVSCSNNIPAVLPGTPGHCIAYPAGSVAPVPFEAGVGIGQRRGMVGLMIENTTGAAKQGDVTRLWGNPRPWGVQCSLAPGYPTVAMGITGPGTPGCLYSLTDVISHVELGLP